jgi:ribosomal protein L37E
MSTIPIKCPQCGNDTFKVSRRAKPKNPAAVFFPPTPTDEPLTCSRCGFKTTRAHLASALVSKVVERFNKPQ